MRLYGLIGHPLGHSFSKKFFSEKFEREGISDARYALFPLETIGELPALLAAYPGIRGLNVTIPHKQSVLPFLDELDETARAVGAVNCIKVLENQALIGYNTDILGFEKSLLNLKNWSAGHEAALILGSGGAAKAVAYVLKKLGIPFQYVSRHPKFAEETSYEMLGSAASPVPPGPLSLLVNATPIGTFPAVDEMPPVPLSMFKPGMIVYDLIYNPAETLLLREARSRGCFVKNGLEMLELQAEAAWEIWQKA